MKNTIKLLGIVAFIILSTQFINAQSTGLPKASDLKAPADYSKYKNEFIKCVDWLESNPVDPNSAQRKEVNKFVLKWITGQNEVHINMGPMVMDYTKGNPDLVAIFLGGEVKYALSNPNEKDVNKLNQAGMEEMVKVYTSAKGINKDEKMDNLVQMRNDKKLDKYISQQMSVSKN